MIQPRTSGRFDRRIPFIIASILSTLVIGYLVNAYYQASLYYRSVAMRSALAAFVDPKGTVATEVISEKLVNLDRVSEVTFVSKEQALENALAANPSVREILVSGDNPFSPYFLIKPSELTGRSVQTLKDDIMQIEGIDDVRFDENAVNIAEQLSAFLSQYRLAGKLIAGCAVLVIIGKFIWAWLYRKLQYIRYLYVFLWGLATSFTGTLLYYLIAYQLAALPILQMTQKYFLYMFFIGIIVPFIWEE